MAAKERAMTMVLIVEDDPPAREGYAALVREGLGFEVVTAEGGEKALALLRGGLTPDLIVLDLVLPDMDGFAFRAQQLADPGLASCPVLICSGNLDEAGNLERLKGAAYLEKPIQPDAFLRLVRAFSAPVNSPR
jgi:two-component system response regulator MprA